MLPFSMLFMILVASGIVILPSSMIFVVKIFSVSANFFAY